MTEEELVAKWIGAKVISGSADKDNDCSGRRVVGILVWEPESSVFKKLGPRDRDIFWIVEAPSLEAGKYGSGHYTSKKWLKLPKSLDWDGHLVELRQNSVVKPNASILSVYSVGPEGETQGFLDGNTGLSFL